MSPQDNKPDTDPIELCGKLVLPCFFELLLSLCGGLAALTAYDADTHDLFMARTVTRSSIDRDGSS